MILKGMTWSHDRGLKPLLAASEEFHKRNPNITIEWDSRSLADFELFPLDQLADKYDFIMIDHPHIGTAYAQNLLLPLDELLPKDFINGQSINCVGRSHESYFWEGHQWALAADAAAQVSAYRPEILNVLDYPVPETWGDVINMAIRLPQGKSIGIPFVPVHAYSSFYSLASQFSQLPVWHDGKPLDENIGTQVLKVLETILRYSHPDSFDMDPIQLLDRMSEESGIIYSPMIYGYSAYSLLGFRNARVKFNDLPSNTGNPDGSMIGGVGLAISSQCKNVDVAAEFVQMVLDPEFQQGIFTDNCGQPGHRSAWLNTSVNETYFDFYKDTIDTLDFGSMRPRFNGYIEFQGLAGNKIRSFVKEKRDDYKEFIEELNSLYIEFYNKR